MGMIISFLLSSFAEEFGTRLAVFAHKELKAWRVRSSKHKLKPPQKKTKPRNKKRNK